jgi:hypothetical protein
VTVGRPSISPPWPRWVADGVPPIAARNAQECGTEPAVYASESSIMNSYTLEDGTVYLTYSTTVRSPVQAMPPSTGCLPSRPQNLAQPRAVIRITFTATGRCPCAFAGVPGWL